MRAVPGPSDFAHKSYNFLRETMCYVFPHAYTVAVHKALPTTEQVEAALNGSDPIGLNTDGTRVKDAGSFIVKLRNDDPDRFVLFLTSTANKAEWHEEPRGEPLHVRVVYLIQIIIRTMEFQMKGKFGDGILSEHKMKKWIEFQEVEQARGASN